MPHWPSSRIPRRKNLPGQALPPVLTHRHDGISGAPPTVVSLADLPSQALIREQAGHHLSFKKGSSTMHIQVR